MAFIDVLKSFHATLVAIQPCGRVPETDYEFRETWK